MRLRVKGFADTPPPSSPRQKVTREGDVVVLELSKETPPMVPLADAGKGADPAHLEATAFIPSVGLR